MSIQQMESFYLAYFFYKKKKEDGKTHPPGNVPMFVVGEYP